MARDRGGVDVDVALRMIDDWVESSARATRLVEQQAEVERKGTTTDDDRGDRRR